MKKIDFSKVQKRAAIFSMLILMSVPFNSFAQSTMGTDFWVTFLPNADDASVNLSLIAAGPRECTGSITNPHTNWSTNFNISVGTTTIIDIPKNQAYSYNGSDCVLNTALHVVSTDVISLYASNFRRYSFDVTDVLPTSSLGSEYLIQNHAISGKDYNITSNFDKRNRITDCSEFAIVAVEDNTKIEILLTCNSTNGRYANQPFTVILQAGQCYQVKSVNLMDFTGTRISVHENKRIAVFSGNLCANIPTRNYCCCDHIMEQMLPVNCWGRHFVITNTSMRSNDLVRVTSLNDNCQIVKDGLLLATINAKQTYQFEITSNTPSVYLETSEPVMVYLYFTGYDYGGVNGDPSMVIISPIEQRISGVTFSTFNSGASQYHYVNIVTDTDKVSGMQLDGESITSQFQSVLGNSYYSFARIQLNHGTHTLSNRNSGFVAHVYGLGEAESYAYSVGSMVKILSSQMLVDGQITFEQYDICGNKEITFDLDLNFNFSHVHWKFGDGNEGDICPISHCYEQLGSYYVSCDVYKEVNGIDSLVSTITTTLRLNEEYSSQVYANGCDSYTWLGNTYTQSGEYVYHGITVNGCDSLVTLNLTIENSETNYVEDIGCDKYVWNDSEYETSGEYEQILQNQFGCDSTVTMNLDMDYAPRFQIEGENYPIAGTEEAYTQYQYHIELSNPMSSVDSIHWALGDHNGFDLQPIGNGLNANLFLFAHSLDSIEIKANVFNRCGVEEYSFWFHTSYYDIAENDGQSLFDIFPNPSSGEFKLCFSNVDELVNIKVFAMGAEILEKVIKPGASTQNVDINLKGCPNGVYCFVVNYKGKTYVKKCIISR